MTESCDDDDTTNNNINDLDVTATESTLDSVTEKRILESIMAENDEDSSDSCDDDNYGSDTAAVAAKNNFTLNEDDANNNNAALNFSWVSTNSANDGDGCDTHNNFSMKETEGRMIQLPFTSEFGCR